MSRLNKERQDELEPKRLEFACEQLDRIGFRLTIDDKKITFFFKGEKVTLFPYSGWHTGKSIKDGRGLNNLLKQLK